MDNKIWLNGLTNWLLKLFLTALWSGGILQGSFLRIATALGDLVNFVTESQPVKISQIWHSVEVER